MRLKTHPVGGSEHCGYCGGIVQQGDLGVCLGHMDKVAEEGQCGLEAHDGLEGVCVSVADDVVGRDLDGDFRCGDARRGTCWQPTGPHERETFGGEYRYHLASGQPH